MEGSRRSFLEHRNKTLKPFLNTEDRKGEEEQGDRPYLTLLIIQTAIATTIAFIILTYLGLLAFSRAAGIFDLLGIK